MRKRIGILLSQMEENTQKSIMEAFSKEAYAHNYDLCVFSSHQKYQQNVLRNIGDNNIYSLAQFDKFDGLLVLLDTILAPGVADALIERIHNEYTGPVIVVDKETSYYESVMMDHYEPLVKLTDHLLEVHKYTDIAFLGGKEGHPHSVQRLNGFLDSMKAHGVPVREDRIWHGDFWFDSGYKIADYYNEHRDDMPQAIVCANDYMAIGLASRFSEYGIEVPKDIAVVGYDSVEAGRLAPSPLTSAKIPASQCGTICFHKLHSEITGELSEPENLETKLFIGGSCGCKCEMTYVLKNRSEWKTAQSVSSFYSDLTHITEDMICQTDYDKFFKMLVRYSYQVEPFYRLWFCLNEGYDDAKSFIGDKSITNGYADRMVMAIKHGKGISPEEAVDCSRVFDTKLMLPELYEEREYPTTFVFTPMFFEDRCFGYSVLNMGPEPCIYEKTFRVWMRSINQGIESFYRQKAFYQMIEDMKAEQIRDSYTGLYNYKGFTGKVGELIKENLGSNKSIGIISIDLDNMKGINAIYGRDNGDAILLMVAKFISKIIGVDEVCGRLANDEFLVGFVCDDTKKRFNELDSMVPAEGIPFRTTDGDDINVKVTYSMVDSTLKWNVDPEYLINQSVNAKNYQKKLNSQKAIAFAQMTDAEVKKIGRAEEILDEKTLSFHFQPIVRAADGSIYGYEALMRDESESHLSPLDIIQAAGVTKRLYDIEKQTFNGVLDRLDETPECFDGKKVFINSLPAYQLKGNDASNIAHRFADYMGRIVVEYTEDSEVSGEVYASHADTYSRLDVEVALDDYGSGYSNANNLLKYTPHYVKLDRGLISDIDNNPQKKYFVKSIIDYSKVNNISVLAEGVETAEELKTVINLGVDLIQGYYTGRPAKEPVANIDSGIELQIQLFNIQKDKTDIMYRVE